MAYLTLGFSIVSFLAAGVIALTTPMTSGLTKAHAVSAWTSSQSPPGLPAARPALR